MLGPFEQAINADDKENIIRKEFTVYHKVDDKVYIT